MNRILAMPQDILTPLKSTNNSMKALTFTLLVRIHFIRKFGHNDPSEKYIHRMMSQERARHERKINNLE